MKIQEAKAYFEKLCVENHVKLIVPIRENARLRTTLGRVKFSYDAFNGVYFPTVVEFSAAHLKDSDTEVIDTITHEFVHYYLLMIDPTEKHGHDAMFRALSKELGCIPRATKKIEPKNDRQEKYSIYCSKCGKLVSTRTRACKITKFPELYRSKCCDAELKVVQNY